MTSKRQHHSTQMMQQAKPKLTLKSARGRETQWPTRRDFASTNIKRIRRSKRRGQGWPRPHPSQGNERNRKFFYQHKYTYWPALIYSSYDAFESTFPLCQDTRQLLVTVARERMLHETNEIAIWTQRGIIPPISTTSESVGNSQTVKVAILLGSDIPPCGMRSYPVFPREISIVRGGVLQKPQMAFKKNAFKNMPGYANNSKFQEAVDMAKQYKTTKDTKILASQKLR